MNKNGRCIHPNATTQTRKRISTGKLTAMSVVITSFELGWCRSSLSSTSASVTATADAVAFVVAACSAVDSRETKIALTPPGRPVSRTKGRVSKGGT